jgi:hypothetical protein
MALVLSGLPAWSYDEVTVHNGGTISGHVTIIGKPKPMAFNLVTIPDAVYCARISTGTGWRIVEDFIIGQDGSLKDAVVMIRDMKKGKLFKLSKPRVDAIDCDFLPFVNIMRDKEEITVINMDPIEHDIQGYETARRRGARILFNRPLPMNPFHKVLGLLNSHKHLAGKPMIEKIHLKKGRDVFVMQCGFHPYMFSWGVVVKNPYFSVTKENGKFEIKDVPPGDYTLSVWHAGMKKYLHQEISVKSGKTTSANFQYKAIKGRRSVHEMQENPHFGVELLGEGVELLPTLRLQKP